MNSEGQSVSERNVLRRRRRRGRRRRTRRRRRRRRRRRGRRRSDIWTTTFKESPVFYSYKNKFKSHLVRVGYLNLLNSFVKKT
jgi:hypothetical protein